MLIIKILNFFTQENKHDNRDYKNTMSKNDVMGEYLIYVGVNYLQNFLILYISKRYKKVGD